MGWGAVLKDQAPQGGWAGDKAPLGPPEVSGVLGAESQETGLCSGLIKVVVWAAARASGLSRGSERLLRGT